MEKRVFSPEKTKGISDNNKEQDIAFFYEKRGEIGKELCEIVEASKLSVEDKKVFYNVIDDFIHNYIEKFAEAPSVFSTDAHYICRALISNLPFWNEKGERYEVFRGVRDTLIEKFRIPAAGY